MNITRNRRKENDLKEKINEYLFQFLSSKRFNISTISCGYGREFFQVFSYKTQIGKKAIPVPKKSGKKIGGEKIRVTIHKRTITKSRSTSRYACCILYSTSNVAINRQEKLVVSHQKTQM